MDDITVQDWSLYMRRMVYTLQVQEANSPADQDFARGVEWAMYDLTSREGTPESRPGLRDFYCVRCEKLATSHLIDGDHEPEFL